MSNSTFTQECEGCQKVTHQTILTDDGVDLCRECYREMVDSYKEEQNAINKEMREMSEVGIDGRCLKCGMKVETTTHYCPQANWSSEGLSFCGECKKPVDTSKQHVIIPKINATLHIECFYNNYQVDGGSA